MQPRSRLLLWDARDAACAVRAHILGRTEIDLRNNRLLRSAVEREFIVIGEAFAQLRAIDPDVATQIPEVANIIGFRKILVHAYGDVDAELVWTAASDDVNILIDVLSNILGSAK